MKNFPQDFAIVVDGGRVRLHWTDADDVTMTTALTGPEAVALGEDLVRKGREAIREEQRLRDLADDQLRAITGCRVRTNGRRSSL